MPSRRTDDDRERTATRWRRCRCPSDRTHPADIRALLIEAADKFDELTAEHNATRNAYDAVAGKLRREFKDRDSRADYGRKRHQQRVSALLELAKLLGQCQVAGGPINAVWEALGTLATLHSVELPKAKAS
jgi:hypothetical protein